MTGDGPDIPILTELPSDVAERILSALPGRGEKVLACLRTAAVLLEEAVADGRGLRLAESAGYNLREALDAVVTGRDPVPGGLPLILDAWKQYQAASAQPDTDHAASWRALEESFEKVELARERSSYRAAQLLGYLRRRTGVDPLPGDLDPIVEYSALRGDANRAVHAESALAVVTALYDRTVAWFIRMFTPPDAVVHAIGALAAEAWQGPPQIKRLRTLATNPHHLRLFCGRLTDAEWLMPLCEAGVLALPPLDAPWPAMGLLGGLGRSEPAAVADVLERLLNGTGKLLEGPRLSADFELLRMAVQLGTAGHGVVVTVSSRHAGNHAVRALSVAAVQSADPAAAMVARVTDTLLNGTPSDIDRYYVVSLLDRLEAGLTEDNVVERTRMLAAKVRRATAPEVMRFVSLDIARLTADLGDERHYPVVTAHYLARVLARARDLGIATDQLREWTEEMPGEIGQRITCRILAGATDVSVQDKIDHIQARLASPTATGDDFDLITDITSADLEPGALDGWAQALGTPSTPPDLEQGVPDDWVHVWRWSLVLPDQVLGAWQEPIARITEQVGPPPRSSLDRRTELPSGWRQSAYRHEDLSGLSPVAAAELVGSWRPDTTDTWTFTGARELARTLESVVKADPVAWTADPEAIVRALHEPVYVLHYFRALTDKALEIAASTPMILQAAETVRTQRWTPAALGADNFDFEPDWHNVDTASVKLAAALAQHDADLAPHLDMVWLWTLDLLDQSPDDNEDDPSPDGHDPLEVAIDTDRGRALQAIFGLAGWEQRNLGAIRGSFTEVLDEVVALPGKIGMQDRAILAQLRPCLEAWVPEWLDRNASVLFGDDEAGDATFTLTIKYSRPTRWFYRHFRDKLIAAAGKQADDAVGWLLAASLNNEDGYTLEAVIDGLRGDIPALTAVAEQIAFLVQDLPAGAPQLTAAVESWQALIQADRRIVPAEALRASGRWAFVTGLADDSWLQLTLNTLEITGGIVNLAIEIADRCKAAQIRPETRMKILLLLLNDDEPWERDHIARAGIETLQTSTGASAIEDFQRLRTRLIELGYHEAAESTPDEPLTE